VSRINFINFPGVFFLAIFGIQATNAQEVDPVIAPLVNNIKGVSAGPDLVHGTLGFYLATVDSGNVIYQYNGTKGLVPASTLKSTTFPIVLSDVPRTN